MQKRSIIKLILIFYMLISFLGCSSKLEISHFEDQDQSFTKKKLNESLKLYKKIFYFDINSDKIYKKDLEILFKHSKILKKNKKLTIFLHGYSDRTDSDKDKNILGKKRAESVKNLLVNMGVNEKQIKIFSYGENKPAIKGNFESVCRLNRRVEMFYHKNFGMPIFA